MPRSRKTGPASPEIPTAEEPPGTVNLSNIDYSRTQQARFYANHVAAQVNLFDVRLLLSSVHIEGGKLIADETITLMMSPELAVVLQSMLTKSIQNYTDAFGAPRSAIAPSQGETKK